MTIQFDKKAGYGQQYMLLKHISVWQDIFKTANGAIKFYLGNPEFVVDAAIEKLNGDIVIYLYPSNDQIAIQNLLKNREEELRKLLEDAKLDTLNSPRSVFTVDLETFEILSASNFSHYSIPKNRDVHMFTVDAEEKDGGFPTIYVISPPKDGPHAILFSIQVLASRYIMSCVDSPTKFGKEFTYSILRSVLEGKPNMTRPEISDVRIPSNGTTEPHTLLKTNALKLFAQNCGADRLIVSKGGIIKEIERPTTAIVPVSPIQPKVDAFDFGTMTPQVEEDLRIQLTKQALEKGTVKLSDIALLGLPSALKAVSHNSNVLPVEVDVQNVAKKMCIFEGLLYMIPYENTKDSDWGLFFGSGEELIMEVEEEGFPSFIQNTI